MNPKCSTYAASFELSLDKFATAGQFDAGDLEVRGSARRTHRCPSPRAIATPARDSERGRAAACAIGRSAALCGL